MKRLVLLSWTLVLLGSCSGDDATPAGEYGEQCDPTKDECAEGLECTFGICTASCSTAEQCRAFSDVGVCMGGTCFDACVDTFNCPNGLVCSMVGSTSGSCRVP